MANRSKQINGTPYQIYSEVAKAGKTLASSKQRVTWRFGWSECEGEHEITLIHSKVSGKKVIQHDQFLLLRNRALIQAILPFSHV